MIYTLCFLTRGEKVLMLHRNKPPNQGLWNGVGGRIEPGETPYDCVLREVFEETGYHLDAAHFAGILTWKGFEISNGGLYLFTAPAPEGDPGPCSEGDLEWQSYAWACSSPDVVSNLHYVLPLILDGKAGAPPGVSPHEHHFVYRDGAIEAHEVFPLGDGVMEGITKER